MNSKVNIAAIIIAVLLLARISGYGQTVFDNYIDGKIYLKVKESYPLKNLNTLEIDFRRELPFLTSFESIYGVLEVKNSFYFTQSEQLRRVFKVHFSKKERVEEFIKVLGQLPEVEYAEKIPLCRTTHTPNDMGANTIAPGQYALHLTQAEEAWDIVRGDPGIAVAIVDNAIQTNHPDLNAIGGRDVSDGDDNPNPPNANFDHGTHCAGIAGARSDNGIDIASIGHGISIMPIKATGDGDDPGLVYDGYEGILWAAMNGADIISNSWSGGGCITCETAVSLAQLFGSIIVAAAGNDTTDTPKYPANYGGVIAVANTDINDVKRFSSNYGNWIDVSAPGTHIQSLVPFNATGSKSGTSMSAPYVAGLIGLAMSARDVYNPGMNDGEVIDCVLSTADNIDVQNPDFVGLLGSGRVNAYEALKCIVPCPVVYIEPFANYLAGRVVYRQASEEIHSSVNCDGCELTHNSGGFISLKPPFHVTATPGTGYWGHIEGCGVSKPEQNKDKSLTRGAQQWNANSRASKLAIYPNPSTGTATLAFTLDKQEPVTVSVQSHLGHPMRTICRSVIYEAGTHNIKLDTGLPAGIYFVTMQTSGGIEGRKWMVVK